MEDDALALLYAIDNETLMPDSEKDLRKIYTEQPLIQEYLDYLLTVKGYSEHTLSAYQNDLIWLMRFIIIRFLKPNLSDFQKVHKDGSSYIDYTLIDIRPVDLKMLKRVRFPDLYAFLGFAARDLKNDENSRKRKVTSIKGFFKFMTQIRRYLNTDPSLELEAPKIGRHHPHYLTLEQAQDLLNAPTGKHAVRDKTILTIFLNTGLRVSELCRLKTTDIQSEMLHIIGKGNKERNLFLNDACLQALAEYLPIREAQLKKSETTSTIVFISQKGGAFTNRGIEHMIEKYILKIGLDPRHYTVHTLRHTAATLMHKYGAIDIKTLQQVLGHESTQTTEIYTHLDNSELQQALNSNPLARYKTDEAIDLSPVFDLNSTEN